MAPEGAVVSKGSITSSDGTKLAFRAWPQDKARLTFAVVHGHGEHSGRYARFAQGMAAYQMATYAVDLRGHGESLGQRGHLHSWSQWVDDAVALVEHVEREVEGEVVPLGHSMGGVVMLSAMRAHRLPNARRFVVSSPALKVKVAVPAWKTSLAGVTSRILPRLSQGTGLDPKVVSRDQDVVDAYRGDPLVHSKMSSRLYAEWQRAASEDIDYASDITLPFLIIAGTADALIDPAGSEELHRRSASMSTLTLFEGRFHEPFNDLGSGEVFATIAEWLGR